LLSHGLGGFGLDSYQIYAPMTDININANPTPKNALRNAIFFQFLIISSDIYAPRSTQHYRFCLNPFIFYPNPSVICEYLLPPANVPNASGFPPAFRPAY
jgi:hypothetical protein